MKICIVTVYNSENCGSFWQAYALADTLEQLGHKVCFLYRGLNDTSQSLKEALRVCLVKCLKFDFFAAKSVWKKRRAYKTSVLKAFNVIKRESPDFKGIDLFVIGSDTVWNFASPYFKSHKDIYTGSSFGAEKCITYAASAANTPYEAFDNDEIRTPINNLKAISVRDEETYNIVKKLTNREAKIVCDPTMLTERTLFDQNAKELNEDNYILLYHFATIGEKVKNEILELKKKHNLKVISFGEHRSWCDKTICYNPYDFISYFKNASFVVTDTFHGTIFSILYEKNFAEYGNRKKKIANLLESLQLTAAVIENNESMAEIFKNGLDYTYANEKIKSLRAESLQYLKDNLMEM